VSPRKSGAVSANARSTIQRNLNDLWRTVPRAREMSERDDEQFPKDPQENLLYFIEKNAPLLEPWQREIVRIGAQDRAVTSIRNVRRR
jgi:spore cortex formation protein SpoVR/YcgB (stage V sporulation)